MQPFTRSSNQLLTPPRTPNITANRLQAQVNRLQAELALRTAELEEKDEELAEVRLYAETRERELIVEHERQLQRERVVANGREQGIRQMFETRLKLKDEQYESKLSQYMLVADLEKEEQAAAIEKSLRAECDAKLKSLATAHDEDVKAKRVELEEWWTKRGYEDENVLIGLEDSLNIYDRYDTESTIQQRWEEAARAFEEFRKTTREFLLQSEARLRWHNDRVRAGLYDAQSSEQDSDSDKTVDYSSDETSSSDEDDEHLLAKWLSEERERKKAKVK